MAIVAQESEVTARPLVVYHNFCMTTNKLQLVTTESDHQVNVLCTNADLDIAKFKTMYVLSRRVLKETRGQ